MWFLAWRQLLSRKKQAILILLGIAFGGTMYITISGMLIGLKSYMLDQLVNNQPHVVIDAQEQYVTPEHVKQQLYPKQAVHWQVKPSGVREKDYIANPSGWYHFLQQQTDVLAYVAQLSVNAIARNGAAQENLSITGCQPEQQQKVTDIGQHMIAGSFNDLSQGGNTIVIGKEVAKIMGVRVNGTLQLNVAGNDSHTFKVVGIFETGQRSLDRYGAYMPINSAQLLKNRLGRIEKIGVRLANPYAAETIAKRWDMINDDHVESWQQQNQRLLGVFTIQDFTRYFISALILIVSAFGIYNVLNIIISQKRKEIAILRSMGYTKSDVTRLFFYQGVLIGLVGGIAAVILGYGASVGLASMNISPDEGVHVAFNVGIYVVGFLLAFLTSIVSTIIPARRAGNLTPIAIIRSDG